MRTETEDGLDSEVPVLPVDCSLDGLQEGAKRAMLVERMEETIAARDQLVFLSRRRGRRGGGLGR